MPLQATALIVYAESFGLSMDFREIPLADPVSEYCASVAAPLSPHS